VSAFAAIRATIKRVKAREQQLVAWRAMLGERVVTRTRIALVVTDVLRIAAYLMVVMETVRAERPMPIAVAIMALGWFALSGLHLAFRDAILVRAFATMNPSTSRTTTTAPITPRIAPLSAGAQAALRRAQAPRKPKVRPKPAIVLADRDAVDFEDAMSGPVRVARDFDDAP
jgi:hypothetical protein